MNCKLDDSLERYKSKLMAKGYTQTYGVNYQKAFASKAKINMVRVLLLLATNFNQYLDQFDVKNAFLHGNQEDEIYMDIPLSFKGNLRGNKVCKLKKVVLYGLKKWPRAWFKIFFKIMFVIKYRQSQRDHTSFMKHSN